MKVKISVLLIALILIFSLSISTYANNSMSATEIAFSASENEREMIGSLAEKYVANGPSSAIEIYMDRAWRSEVYLGVANITPEDILEGSVEPYCICWHIPCLKNVGTEGLLYADIRANGEVSFSLRLGISEEGKLPTEDQLARELQQIIGGQVENVKYITISDYGSTYLFLVSNGVNEFAIPYVTAWGGDE